MTSKPDINNQVSKREIFGWAMYDFANSSYTTVVITYIYSAFFVSQIVPADSGLRDSYWAIAIVISTLLSVILAPVLGAMADLSGQKKKYLTVLTFTSVVFTAALFFVDPGQVWLGIGLLIFSNTAWMLSENFIASFLPEITTPENIGKISGIGWGIGYIGGLLSLVLMIGLITASAEETPQLYISQNQVAMVVVAIFYLLAALPTYLLLKERAVVKEQYRDAGIALVFKTSAQRVGDMMVLIREYPVLFRFFIPFTVYSAGIAVIVKFFGIYASEELNISGTFLIITGAILQLASMIGAITFGVIQDKKGASFTLKASLIWWLLGISGVYFLEYVAAFFAMDIKHMFIVIAFIAGSALGATQSASRAVVGLITKKEDASLSYGLWGVFGKFAIVLGMIFGPISDAVGRHNALLVVMVYFIVGYLLLRLVPFNTLANQPE
ncbi:MFS transporter [Thalassomonas actiniarum]|uniref:MFS transporter n=1 Tax=Thalassomonas actiniarum TaxID=485447 RepID=A0AAE9YZ82_9GAMM|nr:MFS transporter [Thalassomonas actiniarum]WDE02342.1 MFS transporter [Thalassomonas actiniarum]